MSEPATKHNGKQTARTKLRLAADERPKSRADCPTSRPCPWVSCRYHLYLDVLPRTGRLILAFPELEPWELSETCALDAADRAAKKGGFTLQEVGDVMNITRERVRQLEARAREKMAMKSLMAELNGEEEQPMMELPTPSASEQHLRPVKVLADWCLVERAAQAVTLPRFQKLAAGSLAQIAEWARAVARARRKPGIEIPPRPPVLDQILAEHQQSSDDGERKATE